MSKPKSPKNPPADPQSEAEAPAAETEITATSLGKAQKAFLHRISRFLVNIQSVSYSGRAAKNGYTPSVHAEGWKLWSVASGMTRPLDHWFTEQDRSGDLSAIAGDRFRLLPEIDAFENAGGAGPRRPRSWTRRRRSRKKRTPRSRVTPSPRRRPRRNSLR